MGTTRDEPSSPRATAEAAEELQPSPAASPVAEWERRWSENATPWDAGNSPPALIELLSELQTKAAGKRALVTGCGRGYDVFTLAEAGFEATGVDIAPSVRPHFEEFRAQLRPDVAERSSLLTLDFFAAHPHQLAAPYDFIWDYTFYCAIPPTRRDEWRSKMVELLAPDALLATLLFPVVRKANSKEGPPYPISTDAVSEQLAPDFERIRITKVRNSLPGRSGKEHLALWKRRSSESVR